MSPFDKTGMDILLTLYTMASVSFILFSVWFCIFIEEKDFKEWN